MDMMGISFDLMCVAGSKKNLNEPPKKEIRIDIIIFPQRLKINIFGKPRKAADQIPRST